MSSIPPSGPSTGPEFSAAPSGRDEESIFFFHMLQAYEIAGTPAQKLMAQTFINEFYAQYPYSSDPNYPPLGSHTFIETSFSNLVSGTGSPPLDIYINFSKQNMPLLESDLDSFLSDMTAVAHQAGDSWSIVGFPPTAVDTVYINAQTWVTDNPSSPVLSMGQDLLNEISEHLGSNAAAGTIKTWMDAQFTDPNFPNKYPCAEIQVMQGVQSLSAAIGYALPSFTNTFFNFAANLYNNPLTDDLGKLTKQIFSLYQQGWATNDPSIAVNYFQNEINSMFPDYPGLPNYGVIILEASVGSALHIPQLQGSFLNLRLLINGPPPLSGESLTLAQAAMTQITTNWPSGPATVLSTWFDNMNASASDVYMTYPSVSTSFINLLTIELGLPAPPAPTQIDNLYRTVENVELPGFSAGSADYQLLADLASQARTTPQGSHGDFTKISGWAQQMVDSNFKNYPGISQQGINTFLTNFSYTLTLQYYNVQLIMLENMPRMPSIAGPMKDFYITLRSIIQGYMTTHSNPTAAELQTYLNQNYASNNFCAQFPGVPPEAVNNAFAFFGVTSPYTYGTIDDVYAGMSEWMLSQTIPAGSPDAAAFDMLFQELKVAESHYKASDPTVDLYSTYIQPWAQDFQKSSLWPQLNPQTQYWFKWVATLE